MSTALAVAAVTQGLKTLLTDGVNDAAVVAVVGDVGVSALPPDRVPVDGADARCQLNLFLYQVIENAAWRNMGFPAYSSTGDRLSNPPLALDLHYLLMAYGVQELQSEIVLGYGMQALHDTPELSRADLRAMLAEAVPPPPAELPAPLRIIQTSGLADQFEIVRVTPEVLSTEEISRLWTAFGAKYRTSAAYVASCVLIQRTDAVTAAKPVAQRNLKVQPIQQPQLDGVSPAYVAANATLTLNGQQLWQPGATSVQIGTANVAPQAGATGMQLQVSVPDTLLAGVQPVYVSQDYDFQLPGGGLRPGVQSNALTFTLIPALGPLPQQIGRNTALVLDVSPPVGIDQDVIVLFGDYAVPVPARTPLAPPAPQDTTAQISVTVPDDLTPGTTLVRISVDGAQSALTMDNGTYDKPSIEVT